jgi:hypothetical protein
MGRGGVAVEDALGEVTHIRARDNTIVGTAFTSPGGTFGRSSGKWNATVGVPPQAKSYDQPASQPQFATVARPRKPVFIIVVFAIILIATLYFLTQGITLL